MKLTAVCLAVLVGCLAVLSVAGGQSGPDGGKAPAQSPSPEVCQALESYVAKIDAAKSINEPSERSKKYAEAEAPLEKVLKKANQASLLADVVLYASYTEAVASKDATDPELGAALERRSKMREYLLQLCMGYTISR